MEENQNLCPKYGKTLKPGAKFCFGCGTNLAELAKPAVITELDDIFEHASGKRWKSF